MPKTLLIFSSSRRSGNTGQLVDALAEQIELTIIDLADYNIGEYDYQHRNMTDDFLPLFKQLLHYEHIIFACPVYWYAMTPKMKIFFDRFSDLLDLDELLDLGRQLRGKRASVLCTSISSEIAKPFIDCFKATFNYLGMEFVSAIHLNCRNGYHSGDASQAIDIFMQQLR